MFAAKVARSRTNAAPAPMAARSSVAPGREASHTASSEYEGRGANATERKGAAAPDFSAMAVFPPDRTSAVRSKSLLSIAGAADPLERLADQTAERVLRMPNPAAAVAGASCEDRARHDEKAEGLTLARTRSAEASALDGAAAPPAVREVLSSPGQRLE